MAGTPTFECFYFARLVEKWKFFFFLSFSPGGDIFRYDCFICCFSNFLFYLFIYSIYLFIWKLLPIEDNAFSKTCKRWERNISFYVRRPNEVSGRILSSPFCNPLTVLHIRAFRSICRTICDTTNHPSTIILSVLRRYHFSS